ncbi:chromosome segregation protein [compost metagenome]
MEVLPSKMDRDDLDYKFPMSISNGAVEPADIDLGSDSQREIVNFAFRIALLKFLGFDDFPLMLDEFGRTFDEQHRANLIPFIARMIELGQFDQIFYISHFESTHGAFNQAEIVVLDPTNVTVPEVFNKNMVMT